MKCSNCGREIANDSVFCEFCGAQIKNLNSAQPTKPASDKKSKPILGWIIGAAVAVIVILIISSISDTSGSSSVSSSQNVASEPAVAEVEAVADDDDIPWENKIWDDLKPGYIRDSNPPTNVRRAPSRNAVVDYYLDNGAFIYYVPDQSGWYMVYDNDRMFLGYVHKSLIRPAN